MKSIYLAHSTQKENVGVDGITEMDRMYDFANLVADQLKGKVIVHQNNNKMKLMDYIKDSNNKNVDLHVELHSNAADSNVRGFEIYYSNYPILSQESRELAGTIFEEVSKITDVDRGVYADTRLYNSGLAATRDTTAVAVLLEMFFHTNNADLEEYNNKKQQLSKAVADGILKYLKIENTKNMLEILQECTYTPDSWHTKLRTIPNSESMLKKVYYKNKNAK